MDHQPILVIDFGGQYAHLIANRVRTLGAYSHIISNTLTAQEVQAFNPAGIIFSGGPHSVTDDHSPKVDPEILTLGIPVLGICYGHQLIAQTLGGKVEGADTQEFGKSTFTLVDESPLTSGISTESIMWMSHGDEVTHLPEGFVNIGKTADCMGAAIAHEEKKIYGIQFHPEVTHSVEGLRLLENFIGICKLSHTWEIADFLDEQIAKLQDQCEGKKVFLLVSGGVDSSVCFALLEKALGKDRVFGCLVDHGMMRKDEASEVKAMLSSAGFADLHIEDASSFFLSSLECITDPEEKRMIIGNCFLKVQEEVSMRMNLNPQDWLLAQGTIYPDTIESGGTAHASKIKTHHNRVERIQKMIEEGKIVEPIADLYKDEVRNLGRELGLPEKMVDRHPFPGPGLGVRILCTQQANSLDFTDAETEKLKKVSAPYTSQVLPIQSVGVQGDGRSYRHPCVLSDTQFFQEGYSLDWKDLEDHATAISNALPELNRVLLSLSSDYLVEGLEVYESYMTRERIAVLQGVDALVRKHLENLKNADTIWQFPVVLAPIGRGKKETIILRPIESQNAMTASCAHIDIEWLRMVAKEITATFPIDQVLYDLTAKPPGTIEWE